jgi:hypothetical protein
LFGQVKSTRGISERIIKFTELTSSKIISIQTHLPILKEVYQLRNIVAHRSGICDAYDLPTLLITKAVEGERLSIPPDVLITRLAPPCIEIAQHLDRKIFPDNPTLSNPKP